MCAHHVRMAVPSRRDLLGMVPYLLGFHPAEGSLVTAFVGPDRRVAAMLRHDLEAPTVVTVAALQRVAAHREVTAVVVVGYGTPTVRSRVTAVAAALSEHTEVLDVLLVGEGRWFCLGCRCLAMAGEPFDPATTVSAARATVSGMVALPDRASVLALLDPDEADQAAVSAAIAAAVTAAAPYVRGDGAAVVREVLDRSADGHRLSVPELARLALVLHDVQVRDVAIEATTGLMWQRDLWLDVTRRVPDGHVAAPASLVAWCAWMRGDEVLAMAAVRRALQADPRYRLAGLIGTAVAAHIPATEFLAMRSPAAAPQAERDRP
ncbi:DUF4192 domain-containing protein [Dactylosporangium sp. NPDC000521]|uniref:DUF4192 domain-containing protein n=1 Tax=Dactylosporangium sp. NPDC000521 TaxID=3363975 RepID=UPI0036BEF188